MAKRRNTTHAPKRANFNNLLAKASADATDIKNHVRILAEMTADLLERMHGQPMRFQIDHDVQMVLVVPHLPRTPAPITRSSLRAAV